MTPGRADPINEYGTRLSHLEGQVGGISVQVTGLANGFVELGHKIDRIVDRIGQKDQVNWGWVTSAVVALGAFVMLYTTPIADKNMAQDAQMIELTQTVAGLAAEQASAHATTAAELRALQKRVEQIDLYGSRRWTMAPDEPTTR